MQPIMFKFLICCIDSLGFMGDGCFQESRKPQTPPLPLQFRELYTHQPMTMGGEIKI